MSLRERTRPGLGIFEPCLPSPAKTPPSGPGFVQNATGVVEYREKILAGNLATIRGRALTNEDRLRATIIERLMCELRVDLAEICRAYDVAANHFARERSTFLTSVLILSCEPIPAPQPP
jgi:hypothetical protein